jgi:hypothetical protein
MRNDLLAGGLFGWAGGVEIHRDTRESVGYFARLSFRNRPRSNMTRLTVFVPFFLAACAIAPEGLRETPHGDGPTVVIDWDARPLPELPLPNDLATRPDPTSPTGLRLNISVQAASTDLEARTRRKFDELSGFGIYQAISVRFDAPLDLDEIVLRHDIDGDVSDDAFFVIDVTCSTPTTRTSTTTGFSTGARTWTTTGGWTSPTCTPSGATPGRTCSPGTSASPTP